MIALELIRILDGWSWFSFGAGSFLTAMLIVASWVIIETVRDVRAEAAQKCEGPANEDLVADPSPAPAEAVARVPQFGIPTTGIYAPDDFEEALRCSGESCDHHELQAGEQVVFIPIENESPEAVIAICWGCLRAMGALDDPVRS